AVTGDAEDVSPQVVHVARLARRHRVSRVRGQEDPVAQRHRTGSARSREPRFPDDVVVGGPLDGQVLLRTGALSPRASKPSPIRPQEGTDAEHAQHPKQRSTAALHGKRVSWKDRPGSTDGARAIDLSWDRCRTGSRRMSRPSVVADKQPQRVPIVRTDAAEI